MNIIYIMKYINKALLKCFEHHAINNSTSYVINDFGSRLKSYVQIHNGYDFCHNIYVLYIEGVIY